MSFASLKKNRNNFSKLAEELEKTSQPQSNSSSQDDRFWKPTIDKTGNSYAVIRFLPPTDGEDLPWVRIFNHGFKGPGGWLIDNCLTTIGKPCPVCESNTELWGTGSQENQNLARDRKRRLKYISNIYVVKDPANPDNDGKVFLYSFGKKIFDKLNDIMRPQFEDEDPINPFDFWEGANFKLKYRTVDGYGNYDKSEFDRTSALSQDDAELETIYNQQHSLEEFVSPNNFKSYEQIKERLDRVLGVTAPSTNADYDMDESTPTQTFSKPSFKEKVAPSYAESSPEPQSSSSDDEDDSIGYFERLAEEM
jgi:hypothetical protein